MAKLNELQKNYARQIYQAAIAAGLPGNKAMWIVAQSALETTYWTSNVFVKNNNCFGMKMPYKRPKPYILGPGTTAPASEGGGFYAKFSSIKNSVLDLVISWFGYVGGKWDNINSAIAYVDFLISKKYFQGSKTTYKAVVDSLEDQLKDDVTGSPGIGGLVAIALLFALVYSIDQSAGSG